MRTIFWLSVLVGLAVWVIVLRRQLEEAQIRADMYRDISGRLDRRVALLTSEGAKQ